MTAPGRTPTRRGPHRFAPRWRDERGASVVSFVLLLPLVIMFIELIVVGGRLAVTEADIQSAARQAARQASVASGPSSAGSVIDDAVAVGLAGKGFRCQNPTASLGSSTVFWRGGQVEVVVTCTVRLSDLALVTAPGTVTVSATATEPIDQYRVILP